MRRVGISAEEALDWLRRVLIVPVFTAHPTEVARRIGDVQAAADWGVSGDAGPDSGAGAGDGAAGSSWCCAEITSLWQTDEVRSRRPTVYDEIKMGLDYYDVSIFETLPSLYREIAEALQRGVWAGD